MQCKMSESLIFAKIFTTDGTDDTDGRVVSPRRPDASERRPYLESVQSVLSVVPCLWLRLAALDLLRLCVAILFSHSVVLQATTQQNCRVLITDKSFG